MHANNCTTKHPTKRHRGKYHKHEELLMPPRLMVTNVMSLVPKIEEAQYLYFLNNINLAFITEAWLKDLAVRTVVSRVVNN